MPSDSERKRLASNPYQPKRTPVTRKNIEEPRGHGTSPYDAGVSGKTGSGRIVTGASKKK